MGRRRVLVEVGLGRVELSLVRGDRVLRSEAFRDDSPRGDDWEPGLRAMQPRLAEIVRAFDADGAEAVVLYWSPGAVCGVYSCAKSAGSSKAMTAARLALAESAEFPLSSNPFGLVHLATDTAARDAGAQIHTLGAADSDQSAQAVLDMVRSAGLEVVQLAPLDVPAIAHAADDALKRGRGGVAVTLHIGEHGSVLAGAAHGKLKFLRQIGIGTESLVSALTREMRREDGSTIELDMQAARRLLWEQGVPAREQVFDEERRLTGAAVLPLIQPILQRWLVEIKQSLRFGFDDAERAEAHIVGHGPGADIPRLVEVIASQCGLECTDPQDRERFIAAWWAARCGDRLNLLPKALMNRRTQGRLTRGLGVGVAAAGLLMAAEFVMTRMELSHHRRENAALEARLSAALPGQQLRDSVLAIRSGLGAAQARMVERTAPHVRWDAMLSVLAGVTPERVRLSDVRLGVEGGKPICRIVGETPLDISSETLKAYLDALAGVPLVRDCRMGATQRAEGSGGSVQQFEMNLILVDLPGAALNAPRIAGVSEGGHD